MSVKESLEEAKKIILGRRPSPLDFKRGWNDCWSLFCIFDKLEGGGYFSSLNLSFSSPLGFFKEVKRLGFNSLEELFLAGGYSSVPPSFPLDGDIAYVKPHSCLIYYDGYWHSPIDNSILFKKVKPRDITVSLMFRKGVNNDSLPV